jgi:hypothetical protein
MTLIPIWLLSRSLTQRQQNTAKSLEARQQHIFQRPQIIAPTAPRCVLSTDCFILTLHLEAIADFWKVVKILKEPYRWPPCFDSLNSDVNHRENAQYCHPAYQSCHQRPFCGPGAVACGSVALVTSTLGLHLHLLNTKSLLSVCLTRFQSCVSDTVPWYLSPRKTGCCVP